MGDIGSFAGGILTPLQTMRSIRSGILAIAVVSAIAVVVLHTNEGGASQILLEEAPSTPTWDPSESDTAVVTAAENMKTEAGKVEAAANVAASQNKAHAKELNDAIAVAEKAATAEKKKAKGFEEGAKKALKSIAKDEATKEQLKAELAKSQKALNDAQSKIRDEKVEKHQAEAKADQIKDAAEAKTDAAKTEKDAMKQKAEEEKEKAHQYKKDMKEQQAKKEDQDRSSRNQGRH